MKKLYVITLALVAAAMAAPSLEAKDNGAMGQFKESVKRFKKCARLKCDRAEFVKAGRDVSIALAAVLAGAYATRHAIRKGALTGARERMGTFGTAARGYGKAGMARVRGWGTPWGKPPEESEESEESEEME